MALRLQFTFTLFLSLLCLILGVGHTRLLVLLRCRQAIGLLQLKSGSILYDGPADWFGQISVSGWGELVVEVDGGQLVHFLGGAEELREGELGASQYYG